MDLSLRRDAAEGVWDLEIAGGDFQRTRTLSSAVILSLFTDARAGAGALARGGYDLSDDPRGYWADGRGIAWGSHLWLFARRKRTAGALEELRAAVRDALQWIIKRGTAKRIEVAVRPLHDNGAAAEIVIHLTEAGFEEYDFEV